MSPDCKPPVVRGLHTWSKFEGRNGLPGDVNGERLLETSQFTWWIGQTFLVTLYLESPLDLLLLASLSPATIFCF